MKIELREQKRPRVEMIPLIDIVFLLLVFFIYAMLSMAVHRGMPVLLPESRNAKIDKEPAISITIKNDGSIYLNKKRIPLKSLGKALLSLKPDERQKGVLIFGDKDITYQRLFRVLDEITSSGIGRISLQAEVKEEN